MNTLKPSRIAVIGAAGKAGSVIVDYFLAAGFSVHALARDASKLKTSGHPRLTTIVGDAADEAALRRLIDGCQVIVSALGGANNPSPIFRRVTQSILGLISEKPQMRYFVLTGKTVIVPGDAFDPGTTAQRLMMRALFGPLVADKQKEAELLRSSKADWTLLRCPVMTDGPAEKIRVSPTKCPGGKITREGIAAFIRDELEQGRHLREALFISG